jgi:hypothetical protein
MIFWKYKRSTYFLIFKLLGIAKFNWSRLWPCMASPVFFNEWITIVLTFALNIFTFSSFRDYSILAFVIILYLVLANGKILYTVKCIKLSPGLIYFSRISLSAWGAGLFHKRRKSPILKPIFNTYVTTYANHERLWVEMNTICLWWLHLGHTLPFRVLLLSLHKANLAADTEFEHETFCVVL